MERALKVLYADDVIDVRGIALSHALAEVERCLCVVPLGGTVEIVASDENVANNVISWARKSRHDLISSEVDHGLWRIFVKRTH